MSSLPAEITIHRKCRTKTLHDSVAVAVCPLRGRSFGCLPAQWEGSQFIQTLVNVVFAISRYINIPRMIALLRRVPGLVAFVDLISFPRANTGLRSRSRRFNLNAARASRRGHAEATWAYRTVDAGLVAVWSANQNISGAVGFQVMDHSPRSARPQQVSSRGRCKRRTIIQARQ